MLYVSNTVPEGSCENLQPTAGNPDATDSKDSGAGPDHLGSMPGDFTFCRPSLIWRGSIQPRHDSRTYPRHGQVSREEGAVNKE